MKRSLVFACLLLFVLVLPTAALAQYPTTAGDLVIDKTVVEPGEAVRVSGAGFCPNTQVTVTLVPASGAPRTLGTFTTDAQGNFIGTVNIPTDAAGGSYTLRADGQSSDCIATRVLSANLTVRTAAAAVAQAPRAGAAAAVTGIEALPWLLGGLAVIGLGAGMVVVSRRRSRATQS